MFIDINMPEMNGFELERKIRQLLEKRNNKKYKCYAVTAQEDLSKFSDFSENTFDLILQKPVQVEKI